LMPGMNLACAVTTDAAQRTRIDRSEALGG
jgi:hypothetical protein